MILVKLLAIIIIVFQSDGTIATNGNGDRFTCGETLKGFYEIGTNVINICSNGDMDVLVHEIGHYVFYMKLNEKQRQGWYRICGQDTVTCNELFAEEFRKKINGETYECFGRCDIRERFIQRVFMLMTKS